jgi:hypothetical protein
MPIEAIEKMDNFKDVAFIGFAGLMTLVPLLFFLGHIFTKEGRDAVKENPFIAVYFIIFFFAAYYFWFEPSTVLEYIHFGEIGLNVAYWIICLAAFFEKTAPMRP